MGKLNQQKKLGGLLSLTPLQRPQFGPKMGALKFLTIPTTIILCIKTSDNVFMFLM